ncbi:MAG: acyl-CoA dehydrogenase [Desulfobacteraceae bacterium]|nr:acyl-CoA dehydrogenase [Desulfobacteraceae bacterium]
MAQTITSTKDIEFLLHDVFHISDLSKTEKYAEFNKKTVDMIVAEARNLAVKEILPTNMDGDKGCTFEKGKVITPESFKRAYQLYCEGDWLATADPVEYGGQEMPLMLTAATQELFTGANMAFLMYPGLTHGAAKMILELGTEEEKETYVKKMFAGLWSGTMLLTEPDAGTDVGALTTTAVKNPDGTYSITGNKIFISGGEHDLSENIIHTVLARIEGAPAGTPGISLFIVPKIKINPDDSLGESNNVACTGIEEKMGLHGNSTCSLSLDNSIGTLLGEENKGLKGMFLMMNEARFGCGVQAFGQAATSYANAVAYANERIQSPDLLAFGQSDAPSQKIINHPDVRRQLLFMKSHVEGLRTLIYYVAGCFQKADLNTASAEEKETCKGLLEFLIPIVKSYTSDKAFEICTQGVQVFGGYGFISEYPQEQLLRDCKVTSIYEGTNGIQAMDLLGRKLGMKKGKPFMDLLVEMGKTATAARSVKELEAMADAVDAAKDKLGETALHLGGVAMSDKILDAFGSATPFLEVTGDVVMAWLHLMRADAASKVLANGVKEKDRAFYQGQISTAEYFVDSHLPVALGKMEAVKKTTGSIMATPVEAFA